MKALWEPLQMWRKAVTLNIHETPTECPKISTFGHTKRYQYPKATNLKRNLRERPCPSCLDPRTMTVMSGLWRQDTHLHKRWEDQVECGHSNREETTTTSIGISIGHLSLLMEEQEEVLSSLSRGTGSGYPLRLYTDQRKALLFPGI